MHTAKLCIKCGLMKPIEAYYVHPQMRDGHLNKCKECVKSDVRSNYRKNIEYYREYERGRAMLPRRVRARSDYTKTRRGMERQKAGREAYLERNPEKRVAHIKTGNAIRDGILVRQPCEVCGAARVEAHHDDYSRPLDVRWLCTKHHCEHHKNARRHHDALRTQQN